MIRDIDALPAAWAMVAYIALGVGLIAVLWFIFRYVTNLPWSSSPTGRYLVAMSANIGAFFAVYLVLAVWPGLPWRSVIRLGLLLFLIVNCVGLAVLLERYLAKRRRARQAD